MFAVAYFAGTYVRGRYDTIYIQTTLHPSNGFIFPVFYSVALWTTIIMELSTLIILVLYKVSAQTICRIFCFRFVIFLKKKFFFQLYWAPMLALVTALSIAVFVLVQLRFAQIAKFGTLSQAPEVPGVLVPPDSYAQPYMLPPKLQAEEAHNEVELAGTEDADPVWERFENEVYEEDSFREKETAVSRPRIDPEADATHVVEPRLRELVTRVMQRRRMAAAANDLTDEDPPRKPVSSPRRLASRQESVVPDAIAMRSTPKSSRKTVSADSSDSASPPLRDRSVTSFMVMSPQSARSYPHLPIVRKGKEEDAAGTELDDMEPTVVMAALPAHHPLPPEPEAPAPPRYAAQADDRFTADEVERYIDELL